MPKIISLQNNKGLQAQFLDIGATWHSCSLWVAGQRRQVILSANPSDYPLCNYAGATVGRYAGRISNASYQQSSQITLNANDGKHCLHGGNHGLSHRRWEIVEVNDCSVKLSCFSPNGEGGFAGNLHVTASYTVTDENQIIVEYRATSDQQSICNLTNHAYFNLNQGTQFEAIQQQLFIDADKFVPIAADGIPKGTFDCVAATGFDFRKEKAIAQHLLRDKQQKQVQGYDHSFIFDSHEDSEVLAALTSSDRKITMTVCTNQSAIHLYTGNHLSSPFGRYAGIALETQCPPDSPNHPEWGDVGDCMISPQKPYVNRTIFQFYLEK